jgi:hypothetical protein
MQVTLAEHGTAGHGGAPTTKEQMMVRITRIPAADAPHPSTHTAKLEADLLHALRQVGPDEVLRMEAEVGETREEVQVVVEHVAVTHGMRIASWTDGREDYLYVRRAE